MGTSQQVAYWGHIWTVTHERSSVQCAQGSHMDCTVHKGHVWTVLCTFAQRPHLCILYIGTALSTRATYIYYTVYNGHILYNHTMYCYYALMYCAGNQGTILVCSVLCAKATHVLHALHTYSSIFAHIYLT